MSNSDFQDHLRLGPEKKVVGEKLQKDQVNI